VTTISVLLAAETAHGEITANSEEPSQRIATP
jgi:hypothetical protein